MTDFYTNWPDTLKKLNIHALGIVSAEKTKTYSIYCDIVHKGVPANLHYLIKNAACRQDFSQIMPETKSVICVAIAIPEVPDTSICKYARFCASGDYHQVLRDKLNAVDLLLRQHYPIHQSRICVDSAPVLERELAVRAGIGHIGFNRMVIHPQYGSWISLGELLVDVDLCSDAKLLNYQTHPGDSSDLIPGSKCNCSTGNRICIKSCPTGALSESGYDMHRCLSYWSTQHKGEIPEEYEVLMGCVLWGCDRCQLCCPQNKSFHTVNANSPLWTLSYENILTTSGKSLQKKFNGSPLADAHPYLVQRNACIVLGNLGDMRYISLLDLVSRDHKCDWVRSTAKRSLMRLCDEH